MINLENKKKIYFGVRSLDDNSLPFHKTGGQIDVKYSSLTPKKAKGISNEIYGSNLI